MLKSIEGNFENPQVNELLKKHFIELRSDHQMKCSRIRYWGIKVPQ